MEKIIEQCRHEIKAMGIKEYEVYAVKIKTTVVQVKEGKIDFAQTGRYEGLSLRVLNNGRLGFAYTTDLSHKAISQLVEEAKTAATVTAEEPLLNFPLPAEGYPVVEEYDNKLEILTLAQRIEFAKAMEIAAREFSPYIKRVRRSQLKDEISEVFLYNHYGKILHYVRSLLSASILVMAEKDGEAEMGWHFTFSPFYTDLNPAVIGKEAAKMAAEALGAKPIKTQRINVVLISQVASEILDVISHAFLAEEVQKGKSLLAPYLGKTAMSPLVNIYDDGLYPKGYSTRPFDDEGVPQQKTALVEGGVVKGWLYDSYTAAKEKKVSTGNAVRLSLETPPRVGVTNLYLAPGETHFEDLLKQLDTGLVVTDVLGMHTADPVSGDFSVGISGYWVEKGERAFPVKGVAMAGNVLELFKRIASVGNDLRFWGHCGAPSVLVEGVQISGT